METITSFVISHYPVIGILIVGCVIGGFIYKYHTLIYRTKKKVKELPCQEHTKKLDELPVISKKVDELPCNKHTEILYEHSKKIDELASLSQKVDKHTEILQEHSRKLDELPEIRKNVDKHTEILQEHSRKLDKFENNFVEVKKDIASINESSRDMRKILTEIGSALINKKMLDPVLLLQKLSPYRLTEDGEKHLIACGGKTCIDNNLDLFILELEKINPQTAYDVEKEALNVLYANSDKQFFNTIKDYVFLDPNGITLSTTILVMSIYLRDKYFEKYPEILPDIDAVEVL